MESISLNGHKLHEVAMPLVPYYENSVASLSYPKHRMRCARTDELLVLKLPAFLALELYRQAILPQAQTEAVTVKIGGKLIGKFIIVDFRYPNDHSEIITITLQKIKKPAKLNAAKV
ncbi:MAG: hypothetical protein WCI51_22600 [Lentisphaerota bacterium]